MHRNWIALALATAVAIGCGPSEEAQRAAAAEARKAAWGEIEAAKTALDAQRQELAELRSTTDPEDETAAAALAQRESEVLEAADAFYQRVTGFINDDPPVQDEPLTPQQAEAFRMKSAEDMVIAREYIERGGDYRRAIEIYQTSLAIDPDNEELKAALADAEAKRFMSEERLAAVENGMTEDEVVAAIGRPYTRNVKTYPETKVTAWFYPTDDTGNAAGVFFKDSKGELVVYQTKLDAVKAETREVGAEEEGS